MRILKRKCGNQINAKTTSEKKNKENNKIEDDIKLS